jgi:hypothetical protein
MNSIAARRHKNTNVKSPRGGYWEPYVEIIEIPNNRNGHSIRPNMVALKYSNFKKDVDLKNHSTSKECL